MEETSKKYTVKVDDNFHLMDETERYDDKSYSSLKEAIERCEEITIESLKDLYKQKEGIDAKKLLDHWLAFGADPFVYTGKGEMPFSTREFVTEELCAKVIKNTKTDIYN